MSARDDFPFLAAIADGRVNGGVYGQQEATEALDRIDRLRAELETCERRNESLQRWCDNNAPLVAYFRRKTGR